MRTSLILGFLLLLLSGCALAWPYLQAFQATGAAAQRRLTQPVPIAREVLVPESLALLDQAGQDLDHHLGRPSVRQSV